MAINAFILGRLLLNNWVAILKNDDSTADTTRSCKYISVDSIKDYLLTT